MQFVYMEKASLKFIVLSSASTHVGYRESLSLTEDINKATLFYKYQTPKSISDIEYLATNCLALEAKVERKVILL